MLLYSVRQQIYEKLLRCFESSPVHGEACAMLIMQGLNGERCHCVACSFPEVRTRPSGTASATANFLDAKEAWIGPAVRMKMLHSEAKLGSRHCAVNPRCASGEEARRGGLTAAAP